jgi:hypothetical protein
MLQRQYEGKLSKALTHLFPDIGIDEAQLEGSPPPYSPKHLLIKIQQKNMLLT